MRLDLVMQHELQRRAGDFVLVYDEHPSLIDRLGCLDTYLHMLPRQQNHDRIRSAARCCKFCSWHGCSRNIPRKRNSIPERPARAPILSCFRQQTARLSCSTQLASLPDKLNFSFKNNNLQIYFPLARRCKPIACGTASEG